MDFGIKGMLKSYKVLDFLRDIILPGIISLILTLLLRFGKNHSSIIENLNNVLDLGIVIVPVMVSIMLAAYVILLSVFNSGALKKFFSGDKGVKFYDTLNASFAINLLVSLCCLIFIVLSTFISKMGYEVDNPDDINTWVYFFSVFSVCYPIFCLFGIISDSFSTGRVSNLENQV